MSDLRLCEPNELGLDPARTDRLRSRLEAAVNAGEATGISVAVAREGKVVRLCAGRTSGSSTAEVVDPETVFLVASVTKPVVVTAVALLIERGMAALDQPVAEIIPEFGEAGKSQVTIRHLMTHTSGLPDMLPENQQLREQHAPLSEFIRRICRLELLFAPGTRISYQSAGTATLGELVEQVDGRACPRFLKEEFFQPIGMDSTCLGLESRLQDRLATCDLQIPGEGSNVGGRETDWGWNSDYWRQFGAPWGGMFATPTDLCRFLQMFGAGGRWGRSQILSSATVRAMVRNQTELLPDLPETERRREAWGLGWRLNPGPNSFPYGDLASPGTFGHAGATGTIVWHDPHTKLSAAVFCTRPLDQSARLLHHCSSLIAAAGG